MSMQPKAQGRASAVTTDATREETWTIERIVRWMQGYFTERGIDSPRLDAELLVAQALGKNRTYLYTHGDQPLTIVERDVLRAFVKRRASCEPMAYILGSREFFGRDFKVNRAVLVPRPETEHIVEAVLAHVGRPLFPKSSAVTDTLAAPVVGDVEPVRVAEAEAGAELTYEPLAPELEDGTEGCDAPEGSNAPETKSVPAPLTVASSQPIATHVADPAIRICDVGTGSGALALTLAAELPQASVLALDISDAALKVAHENAAALGVAERVRFLQSDLFTQLAANEAPFDVIVSNPPYIGLTERPDLSRDVRDFEPAQALFAGDDGLSILRPLCAQVFARLKPGGLFLTEIGHTQAAAVTRLLRAAGPWRRLEVVEDLAGLDRVVLAER